MVEAGDETGYALVDEDGDGIGTVYSWGGDDASQLGRVASTSEPKYYACPCYKNAGDPTSPSKGEILDNIVSLTAGDCMAIMIDKDSYVWSFGHGQQLDGNLRKDGHASDTLLKQEVFPGSGACKDLRRDSSNDRWQHHTYRGCNSRHNG